MATAGSGDVLTGAIGALLAAGEGAFEAACAGVYLHAWAGDRAALEIGGQGLLAGDIADRLPAAIRAAREGGIA
jgi:NAD(P)H-hydrate epimerase